MLCIYYFLIKRKKLFGQPNIIHIRNAILLIRRFKRNNLAQRCPLRFINADFASIISLFHYFSGLR